MLGNEDRNTPSSSESIPLEALSSVQSPVMRLSIEDPTAGRAECLPTIRRPSESQASDQEGYVNDSLEDMAAASPPLGVKLTVYRFLNMVAIFAFCVEKDILSYKGQSITPTTLDLVSGMLAVVLYWIGQYEGYAKKLEWFFQFDLAPLIGYCVMHVVGEVVGTLFFLDGLFVITSLSNLLGNLAVHLLVCHRPHDFTRSALWGVYFGVVISAHVLWYSADALIRLVRAPVREWQCAMRFMSVFGPAPLPEQRGWFRVARTIVRSFFGLTLVGLSQVMGKFSTESCSKPEPDQAREVPVFMYCEPRRITHHRTAPQFIARTTRQQKVRIRLFDQGRLRFRLRFCKFPDPGKHVRTRNRQTRITTKPQNMY